MCLRCRSILQLAFRLWFVMIGISLAHAEAAELLWREAEDAVATNFVPGRTPLYDGQAIGASGGMYLRLLDNSTEERFAEYRFDVKTPGEYRLWIAASPTDVGWASPFSVRWIDMEPVLDLKGKRRRGNPYGLDKNERFFFWTDAGTRRFDHAGEYAVRLLAGPGRANDGRRAVYIDALALTSGGQPAGGGVYRRIA